MDRIVFSGKEECSERGSIDGVVRDVFEIIVRSFQKE